MMDTGYDTLIIFGVGVYLLPSIAVVNQSIISSRRDVDIPTVLPQSLYIVLNTIQSRRYTGAKSDGFVTPHIIWTTICRMNMIVKMIYPCFKI